MTRRSFGVLVLLPALIGAASATAQTISISVGPDQVLNYPGDMTILPDEHTTFFPPAAGSNSYTVFAAGNVGTMKGTVVLQTSDFTNFALASGYASPVMSPPVAFTSCNAAYDTEFDENYSDPGSVLQDPTRPPGNLMMFYEAENHCPGGVSQQPFYAAIGFARSSDNGVTWPKPENGPLGGANRYPVLTLATPEPASEPVPAPMGNAIPAAFVTGSFVYVAYIAPPGPGLTGDGKLRIARAQLGGGGQLTFSKWYNGSFSQPGIGGLDSGALPGGGCIGAQGMGAISYVDVLGLYLMTFVCRSATAVPPHAAWYFSLATSLELQDWTVPQMIENSQYPLYEPCPGSTADGGSFDGWYPSFMSPYSAPGHLGMTGSVFFMSGCDVSAARKFTSRTFSITVTPAPASYQGLWWNAAESGWGINFAHQADLIFATWYTYDSTGRAWWLSMLAARATPTSSAYAGTIYVNSGPPFNNFVGMGVPAAAGSGTLTFSDASHGSFAYTVDTTTPPTTQTKAITRFDLGTGPQPTCSYSATTPNFAAATNYQDLWWVPNGAESGWGINFAHQGNSLFATWYTYNFDQTPLWLSALVQRQGNGNVFTGSIYQNSGPRFDSFDTTKVVANPVGTATLAFADGDNATFGYTVMVAPFPGPITQSKQITRFRFAGSGGTVCQ